ncbi:Gag-Pol polyprotein [Gossypium australe]|uniref:Gag-Pol polyprotein n=1 Tax=Gossypium australe TaxID=47621 RepID=A0A5B6UXL6_9ROSI|nr:Gag-Pol polyprotein [Gossypium australe]
MCRITSKRHCISLVEHLDICGTKRKSHTEFRKKYISQQFIDQKRKEFLELKQGRMSVTEYEREFVRLNGLNEDIRLLVEILEVKEFVVLVDGACKAKELGKEKRKANFEARDLRKRLMSKPYQSSSKKSWDSYNCSNASVGYSNRDCRKQYTSPKAPATSVSSIGSNARPSNTAARGRPPRNTGNVTSSKGGTNDSAVRSQAREPARAYSIRARENASSPDVITGTFSIYDTDFARIVLLMTRGYYFSANLMLLLFDEFDVILGMDWLTLYDAIVNCRRQTIELKCHNNEIL